MTAPVVLLKLGGSLITDKERPETAREEVIGRLAEEVAVFLREAAEGGDPPRLIVGHGSGSFGHVAAARHRVHEGLVGVPAAERAERLRGVAEVQGRAAELHRRVLEALRRAGLPAFSIAPSSAFLADGGRPARLEAEPLRRALAAGLVPVVYGDVVMDRERGCAIASTETVFAALVAELRQRGTAIDRVLWAGATDGVLSEDGRTIPRVSVADQADPTDSAATSAGPAAGTDVTGGMRHRLESALALARRGVESLIFDGTVPGRLVLALRGEAAGGTRVSP